MRLLQFEVGGETYEVCGEYELCELVSATDKKFPSADFYGLSAKKLVNGKYVTYTPSGETFAGHKYEVSDMVTDFLEKQIMGDSSYTVLFIEPGLQKIIDAYIESRVISVNGKPVPACILAYNMGSVLDLIMVTCNYIFYGESDDSVVMLSTMDRSLISNNYFASVGLTQTMDAVENGTDALIFGEKWF